MSRKSTKHGDRPLLLVFPPSSSSDYYFYLSDSALREDTNLFGASVLQHRISFGAGTVLPDLFLFNAILYKTLMRRRVKGREELGLRKLGEGRVCSSTCYILGATEGSV